MAQRCRGGSISSVVLVQDGNIVWQTANGKRQMANSELWCLGPIPDMIRYSYSVRANDDIHFPTKFSTQSSNAGGFKIFVVL